MSYRTEGAIYAKYILTQRPNAKIAILYQNDDFGKDYIVGVKSILGNDYDKHVVSVVSYEVSDATVDSQVSSMQASGADCLITAATPKFGAQVIRRVYDIGWKALHCITNVSSSVGSVLKPVGLEKAVGIVTSTYLKDTNDPVWKNDAGMNIWREFAAKYTPELDITDNNNVVGYGYAATTHEVLKQCGRDMSRENIMRQAANLNKLDVKILLPGITINTSPTNFRPIRQMQLVRWTGEFWDRFGDMLEG